MTQDKIAARKQAALEKAFLAVDQIAEDLIRLIGFDLKYAAQAKASLKQIMKIKEDLLKVVGDDHD
jgi:hypothetical protein